MGQYFTAEMQDYYNKLSDSVTLKTTKESLSVNFKNILAEMTACNYIVGNLGGEFQEKLLKFYSELGTDIWNSELQKKYCEKYLELTNSYDSISESLLIYIKFLNMAVENYENLNTTLKSDIDKNINELEVNSN